MSSKGTPIGNPAVVGLAGFALTTFLLQIHNLGLMEIGPVIWAGLFYGGLAQLIAGLQEQKTGNNFGYSAFTSYGAFWIALCFMLMGKQYGWYAISDIEIAWFMAGWAIYTGIMCFGAVRIHTAMAFTFVTLEIGFIFLTIGHFGVHVFNTIAAYDLLLCAGGAWYMMAAAILKDVCGRDILPLGTPLIKDRAGAELAGAMGTPAE